MLRGVSSSTGAARLSIALSLMLAPTLARAQDTVVVADTTILRTPIRVCAGGDVTLGTNLDTAWMRRGAARLRAEHGVFGDPASLLAPLRPLFADADIVLINVETAIGQGPTKTKCGPRSKNCFAFRSPASAAPAIRTLGRADA